MNTRPRLVCSMVRHWCALVGNENTRHIASCAACQEYFRAGAAFDVALRREAVAAARAVPAPSRDFERRLLHALQQERREASGAAEHVSRAQRRQIRSKPVFFGALIAGAAAVVTILVLPERTRTDELTRTAAGTEPVANAEAAALVNAVQSVSTRLTDTLIPRTLEIVTENPLQQELRSIVGDARSALDFLALNFLPTTAHATSTDLNEAPPTRRI